MSKDWRSKNKYAIEALRRTADKLEGLHKSMEQLEGEEDAKKEASEFATRIIEFARRTDTTTTELEIILTRMPMAMPKQNSIFLKEDIRAALARNKRRAA